MKMKIVIIVLAIASLGLGIALFANKKSADEQHTKDLDFINDYSNQVVGVNVQLKDLSQANLALTNDLALSRSQSLDLSNSLATASTVIADTKSTLATAQGQITNLNSHISDLEVQNKVLDQRANDLTNTITKLSAMIEDTSIKLAIAETNREFLSSELSKQMAQKAELEHKFTDINEVRSQVKKLKDEMFIARRMQLSRNDTSGKKGAELLMTHASPAANPPAKLPPNYNLNVEVGSDGSVKIIPPLTATNAPAH